MIQIQETAWEITCSFLIHTVQNVEMMEKRNSSHWYLHVLSNWDLYLHSYLFSSKVLNVLENTQFEKLIWKKNQNVYILLNCFGAESSGLPNDTWTIHCLVSRVLLKMWEELNLLPHPLYSNISATSSNFINMHTLNFLAVYRQLLLTWSFISTAGEPPSLETTKTCLNVFLCDLF